MLAGADADKLERDLRTLIPVLVALAYREQWDSKILADRVVKLVMRCARDPEPSVVKPGGAAGGDETGAVSWC